MLLLGAAAICAGGSSGITAASPTAGEVRGYYYTDNSGIRVATTAASLDQPLPDRLTVFARVLADRISVQRTVLDPGDPGATAQLTGHEHHEPDAVTSASATAGGGGVAEKWRYEGLVGLSVERSPSDVPLVIRGFARGSTERDYKSISGQLHAAAELFQRNTTVSAFIGAGHDWVQPVEAPPGEHDVWPATHWRSVFGVGLSQLLAPRLVVTFGATATFQRGVLSNPYRRALVKPDEAKVGTLFPERLPRARDRYTGFAGLSWYVGRGLAVHLQQGAYFDSWSVEALIPEITVAQEIGRSGLAVARYRFYTQGAASFHDSHYHTLETRYLSGDPRLGGIRDHTAGAELRWNLLPSASSARLNFAVGYEVSILRYHSLNTDRIVAHIPMIAITGGF